MPNNLNLEALERLCPEAAKHLDERASQAFIEMQDPDFDMDNEYSCEVTIRDLFAIAACIVRLGEENDLAKDVLTDIHDIAINYDGYEKAEDLKGLVDELKGMATKYLANLKAGRKERG